MKKALSVLLALALAMSLAVCAAAKETIPEEKPQGPPTWQAMEERMAPIVDAAPSLTFELPVVTSIAAVWNGTTLVRNWLRVYFSPENVDITVTFDDASTETLGIWWDEGNGWNWNISYDYDEATGKVLFYYEDSNLWAAYRATLIGSDGEIDWNLYDYEAFRATLPQTFITVPANLREQYINSLVKTELKLGESKKATVSQGERKLFTFTPTKDGPHYFYSENLKTGTYPHAVLMDASLVIIERNFNFFDNNFDVVAELQAGKTYYLVVAGYYYGEGAGEFDVAVSTNVRKIGFFQMIEYVFAGGWFRWRWGDHGDDAYAIFGRGTWMDNAKLNWATDTDDFFRILIGCLERIRWSLAR